MMEEVSMKKQLIVVTGCTGTGKTKLGIELAKKFNGEVISADSMQIYQGLDIITNTVTTEEMDGIVHHCVNYVSPLQQYNVSKFTDHTIPIIRDILSNGKIPIIVGGTAYYIEALLWDMTLTCPDSVLIDQSIAGMNEELFLSSELSDFEKLQRVDPCSAAKLHPNDHRKIKRSLEVLGQYGTPQSILLDNQHQNRNDKHGILRWDAVLVLSMECSFGVLDVRLDKRVDEMVKMGLCSELHNFCREEISSHESGLLNQVIGYKEFGKYIELVKNGSTDETNLKSALAEGLIKMKASTRRYARKQMRWINNRLDQEDNNYKLIRLDTSYPEKWQEDVSKPSNKAVSGFLNGTLQFTPRLPSEIGNNKTSHSCKECGIICIGDISFSAHIKSRRHRKKKAYLKRKPLVDEFISSKGK